MSWIDDEADKDQGEIGSAEHKREIIQKSNLYASIIRQIVLDVEKINNHPHWKPRLASFPLRFERIMDHEEGYAVSKSDSPGVTIIIRNKGNYLVIERRFLDNPVAAKYQTKEKLNMVTKGDEVCLMTAHEVVSRGTRAGREIHTRAVH